MIVLVEDFKLPHLQLCFAYVTELNLDESILIDQERKQFNSLTHKQRKKTFLGVRELRNALKINTSIVYLPSGKPILKNNIVHISISHTKDIVALASCHKPIGIDIEFKSRDCSKIINKYVSIEEKNLYQGVTTNWPLELWCAKEAVYKLYDLSGLSLKEDITIEQRTKEEQIIRLQGSISKMHPFPVFEVQLIEVETLLIAVACSIGEL